MNDTLKSKMWDALRPVHAPITRQLRRRFGRNYAEHPEMELPPPYEAVQLDVERHLHQYLHVPAAKISQIVIVGAYECDEALRMRTSYPNANILCFEPNPKSVRCLTEKFRGLDFMTVRQLALAESPGRTRFFEMAMGGNGSLLEPDSEQWSMVNQSEEKGVSSFEVSVSTLDREAEGLGTLDLLWMDVQGAEGRVLVGGGETLRRTRAVFIEVALCQSPYKGAALFPEISAKLQSYSFTCVGLGIDGWNGTGNALFVREFEKLVCQRV